MFGFEEGDAWSIAGGRGTATLEIPSLIPPIYDTHMLMVFQLEIILKNVKRMRVIRIL